MHKFLISFLVYVGFVLAQPVITVTPNYDDLSESNARIMWLTDVDAQKALYWGTSTGNYTNTIQPNTHTQFMTSHSMYMTGIPASSTIYYRVCNAISTSTVTWNVTTDQATVSSNPYVDGDFIMIGLWGSSSSTSNTVIATGLTNFGVYYVVNTSGDSFQLSEVPGGSAVLTSGTINLSTSIRMGKAVCSSEQTLTTPAGSGTVDLPIAPTVQKSSIPTMPTSFTAEISGTAADTAAEIQAQINTWAALNNTNNYRVLIPAGTKIFDMITLPARACGSNCGYIQIRSGADDDELPPEGTRAREEFFGAYATIFNNAFPNDGRLSNITLFTIDTRGPGDHVVSSSITPGTGDSPIFRSVGGANTAVTSTVQSATRDGVITSNVNVQANSHGCETGNLARITYSSGSDSIVHNQVKLISVTDANNLILKQVTAGAFTVPASSTITCNDDLVAVGTYVDAGSLPADGDTCSTEDEIQFASESNIRWCAPEPGDFATLRWRQYNGSINAPANGQNPAILVSGANANKYWVGPGLRLRMQPNARVAAWGTNGTVSGQTQGWNAGLIFTNQLSNDNVFDRISVEGLGYPNRTGTIISWNGVNNHLINSRITGSNRWFTQGITQSAGDASMIAGTEIHGTAIYNNFIGDFAGIGIFYNESRQMAPDTAATPTGSTTLNGWVQKPSTNLFVHRNTFKAGIENFMGGFSQDVIDTNRMYHHRHGIMEFKRGKRVEVSGNRATGAWSSVTQGAPLLLTPITIAGGSALTTSAITSITDGTITFADQSAKWWRGSADQEADLVPETEGMRIAITGTSNGAHNGVIYELLDVSRGGTITATVASGLSGSSTGGTATLMSNDLGIADIDFKYNTLSHVAYFTTSNGYNIVPADSIPNMVTRQGRRYAFRHNLLIDGNKRACRAGAAWDLCNSTDPGFNQTTPSTNASIAGIDIAGGSFNFWLASHGVGHATVMNNTLVDVRGSDIFSFIEADISRVGRGPNTWLKAENNIVQSMYNVHTSTPDAWVGYAVGAATGSEREGTSSGLDYVWGSGRWSFKKNVLCCNSSATRQGWYTGAASDNVWPSSVLTDFTKYTRPNVTSLSLTQRMTAWDGFNFRLRYDSDYKSGGASPGTDRKDVGVDMAMLDIMQGKVKNARVRNVTSTTAIVSYMAPDTDDCTVEVSTSTTWGTGTRTSDGGGDRIRNVNISLDADDPDYIRIFCAVEQYECPASGGKCTVQ